MAGKSFFLHLLNKVRDSAFFLCKVLHFYFAIHKPAGNAIRPNVIGRKNWLFSVSEAGAKANAVCLSIAETAKSNGVDFYEYLKKLLTDLPNLGIHQNHEILDQYMPWSKLIQEECSK